jgi:hypothetical protein
MPFVARRRPSAGGLYLSTQIIMSKYHNEAVSILERNNRGGLYCTNKLRPLPGATELGLVPCCAGLGAVE